jgi:hypothetical protein
MMLPASYRQSRFWSNAFQAIGGRRPRNAAGRVFLKGAPILVVEAANPVSLCDAETATRDFFRMVMQATTSGTIARDTRPA